MGTISLRSRYSIINTFRVIMELVEFGFMFTIEKPKQIYRHKLISLNAYENLDVHFSETCL